MRRDQGECPARRLRAVRPRGLLPAWLEDLVDGCLGQTLPAKTYVACKFVIGESKKTRAKYDPDMLKHLSEALRGAGLEEDRGASACEQCQGMYKYQHDTDKDLKYLHVFPRVDIAAAGDDGGDAPAPPAWKTEAPRCSAFRARSRSSATWWR